MDLINLKKRYNSVAEDYIKLFCEKHDLIFDGWIGDRIGEVGTFGDFFIDYRDIRHDIDNNVSENKFFEWYDLTLTLAMEDKAFPNYENFLKLKIDE